MVVMSSPIDGVKPEEFWQGLERTHGVRKFSVQRNVRGREWWFEVVESEKDGAVARGVRCWVVGWGLSFY